MYIYFYQHKSLYHWRVWIIYVNDVCLYWCVRNPNQSEGWRSVAGVLRLLPAGAVHGAGAHSLDASSVGGHVSAALSLHPSTQDSQKPPSRCDQPLLPESPCLCHHYDQQHKQLYAWAGRPTNGHQIDHSFEHSRISCVQEGWQVPQEPTDWQEEPEARVWDSSIQFSTNGDDHISTTMWNQAR